MRRADLDKTPRGAPRNDALHSLQGRPGTDRKGVRLTAGAWTLLLAVTGLAAAAGCSGPLATTFSSASLGTSADGTLRHPASLPFEGAPGFACPLAASAGVAVFPDDGETYHELLAAADARMYARKGAARAASRV